MFSKMLASPAALILVLLPCALLHAADDEQPQSLSLPALWSFSADLSFPSSHTSALNSYTEIAPFSLFVPVLSSSAFSSGSKGFSFGFISLFQTPVSPPSQISLCICLGVRSQGLSSSRPFVVPVWALDTTRPLQQLQSPQSLVRLQVDDRKELALVDGDDSKMWAVGDVSSMEMQNDGNLVIYGEGSNASVVWQSFDHPSDSMLQGQRLKMGMELTSRNGMYKAFMDAGGLVYYLVSANPVPLVYWIYPASKAVDDYFEGMVTVFALDRNAPINLTAFMHSPICNATSNVSLAYCVLDGETFRVQDACGNLNMNSWSSVVDFMRLDRDGVVRDYLVHEGPNSSYTMISNRSEVQSCFTPNVCGAYGICFVTNTFGSAIQHSCRCPAEEDSPALANEFVPLDISNPSEGCRRKTKVNCGKASSQSLAEIRNVAYMSMLPLFEVTWQENTKSLEDCKASCSANCSCSGFIYHRKSSFCLPFGDTTPLSNVSFLSLPSDEHLAFVKIQLIEKKSKSQTIIIATAVIVPVIAVTAVLLAMYWNWKKRNDPETKLAEQELLDVLPMLPTRYTYNELKRFTKGFSKRLGAGGFGSVYEGFLPDSGRQVAVKNLELMSHGQKEFLAEIATIGGISHVNIVKLYGFCLERQHRLLVYEYMENGSLDKWLFPKEGLQELPGMSWETRYHVALGTARGLAYLHEECPKPILHFDVKPQNILLDANLEAKLADFGLAKLVARDQSSVMTVVRGTPGYIAPEWVSQSIVSKKCDVYSFGMVLLELVSGRKNVDMELMGTEQWYFPKWAMKKSRLGEIADLVDIRLAASDSWDRTDVAHQDAILEQVKTAVRVALLCIHEEPEMRPTMTAVCGMLEGNLAVPNDIISRVATSRIPEYNVTSSGTVEGGTFSSVQGR